VVFDIGNVLIHWNPRNLYRRLIADEAEMEMFLAEVCTDAWNLEMDRGARSWAEAVAERVALFPQHEALIRAYDERWSDMVPGPIEGSVAILAELDAAGVPLYAITNFSAEKFVLARERFSFLDRFRDTVVSAHEKMLKPDPRIYRILLERNGLDAADTVFVDDSAKNVAGAAAVGMTALHFTDPSALRRDLAAHGLPVSG
jgi:2-haloacid dehalogenase